MESITLGKERLKYEEIKQGVSLHQELVRDLEASLLALKNSEIEELDKLTNRTRETTSKLLITFKEKDDLSTNLRSIYLLINTLIIEGEMKRDPSQFERALKAINPITRGFKSLESKK